MHGCLIDTLKAFDTVDHTILIDNLMTIKDYPLRSFTSHKDSVTKFCRLFTSLNCICQNDANLLAEAVVFFHQ